MRNKKNLFPILAGAVSFYISVLFTLGAVLGYICGEFGSGKRVDQPGRIKSIKFSLAGYKIHLHHWFISLLGIVAVVTGGFYFFFPTFVFGFLGGLTLQGVYCHSDWYKIIKKKR